MSILERRLSVLSQCIYASLFALTCLLHPAVATTSQPLSLQVNESRVVDHIHTLATHNDLQPPSVQRILFTQSDVSARSYIRHLMSIAGLSVRDDPVGNIFGLWSGSDPSLPAIATGSHYDAIPHSGMFDGTLGLISAIEAVWALRQAAFSPVRSIVIIAFTSEEPTRFGLSCIGSRLLSGAFDPSDISRLRDAQNVSFDEARAAAGYDATLADISLHPSNFSAFIELHIEQADMLQSISVQIGAVTAIAAPAALQISFEGHGGHAGSLLMHRRNDALLAAAELALRAEEAALATQVEHTVATVGVLDVFPRAVNSVPRRTQLSVDVRDIDGARRDSVVDAIVNAAHDIAEQRAVSVQVDILNQDEPARCSKRLVQAVEDSSSALNLSVVRMVSRAYHDALFMARVVPTVMIFVPCRDGISHRPDEFVEPRDIKNGVSVLANMLAKLSQDTEADAVKEEL